MLRKAAETLISHGLVSEASFLDLEISDNTAYKAGFPLDLENLEK